jgi:hypothetical protein
MPSADDYEVLGALVAADEAAGEPDIFVLTYTGSGPRFASHPGWPDERPAPTHIRVDELADHGWVRITQSAGKGRHFAVTGEGRRAWERHVASQRQAGPGRVSLGWPAARQLLEQIYDRYLSEGAREMGVDTLRLIIEEPTGAAATAMIRELARAGYLDITFESVHGPQMVRPTSLTLQMLEGWPSGPAQDAVSELVAALDTEIAHTDDAQKRSVLVQVRDGLVGAAWNVAPAYFEKKMLGM